MIAIVLLIVFAYLMGSVPSGYIIGRISGIDVRSVGSGNIGATNVVRALGKGRGALTLFADVAKGYLPVFVGLRLEVDAAVIALVAIAAFLGHLYPLFLNFQGGKGVATTLGALLALAPTATLVLVVVFAVAVLVSRIVSLGAITAAMAAPVALWFFSQSLVFAAMGLFLGAMIILRHRGNIQRLFAGTEPRFGSR
jgi:glycerol-3-phosphate acyltransferase PlsY